MLNIEQLTENYIDHEVRVRVQEKAIRDIRIMLRSILGVAIGAIIIPIVLHHYHLL